MNHGMKRRVKVIKKKKKLILKKWIRITLLIIFILLFIFSFLKILLWTRDSKNSNKIKKEITKNVKVTEKQADSSNTEIVNPPSNKNNDYYKYIQMDMISVDFNDLLQKNSDTIGWIKVNGTNINYPVVQTNNNDYYLTHAYDKSKNKAGWVFADYRNNFNNLDKNTIIYAHGRVDGTMFGSLKKTLNNTWYKNKNNHVVKFSTKNENTLWQVFSVYTIKAESYYITTQFNSSESFNEFVNTLKKRSKILFDTEVSGSDKIITLSTCKDSKGNRIVMHAKLIKIENK